MNLWQILEQHRLKVESTSILNSCANHLKFQQRKREMSVAFLQQSFLISPPFSSTFRPRRNTTYFPVHITKILCKHTPDDEPQVSFRKSENKWGKLALVAVAAGVLTVDPASAAKTGGRVGGQAFRSSAPRSSSPRINNSRTNIYVNPPVAPPLVGGYGYGVPFYGGWGWSPFSFFAPGPGVAVGVGGGFDTLVLFLVLGAVASVLRRVLRSRDEDEY
ncbi:FLUCTUATING-LIGHT-ACCLIMATION protein 1, chloroplastic [Nicotiana sylvestris]|uniref:Uncharacterized protein LOC104232835 n=1 Tax=Nicotiana sylvestris TaxID=4096 RepID=A0A1U7XD84_NICSY|nr:PREDICTED: uncharacterized protein LOC104232835 [Nicotiana sylvestris]